MNTSRFVFVLTIVNLALLVFNLIHIRQNAAHEASQMLRGKGLEIVDDSGRVRASIGIMPEQVAKADGKLYTETVLLRLINSKGRPNVKLSTSEIGSGLGLGGESDPTYVQILAQGENTSLKLTNHDGKEQLIKP